MYEKTFAVVVTYRRAEILNQCLKAVLLYSSKKVDQLHVIVNSSDRETLKVIEEFQHRTDIKITSEVFENVGPAGGFYYGLKEFLRSDCEFVWLMDDDIIPEKYCLENLILTANKHPYVLSKVLKPSREKIKGFGWWGVLISKEIIERVGLPIKEFFYWTEDTEYLQNRMIRKHKIVPILCEQAVVTHLHDRSSSRPSWFYYYIPRNTIHYRLQIFPLNSKGRWILFKMISGLLYRIAFKEPDKFRKINNFFLGVIHGYKGKLGKVEYLHTLE